MLNQIKAYTRWQKLALRHKSCHTVTWWRYVLKNKNERFTNFFGGKLHIHQQTKSIGNKTCLTAHFGKYKFWRIQKCVLNDYKRHIQKCVLNNYKRHIEKIRVQLNAKRGTSQNTYLIRYIFTLQNAYLVNARIILSKLCESNKYVNFLNFPIY